MKRLMNYFLKGLLVFVPAALTVFAIVTCKLTPFAHFARFECFRS